MLPFLHPEIYPERILKPLANYLINPKASTDSDIKLSLALRNHQASSGKKFIFDIPMNSLFLHKGKVYRKGKKRRTRFECIQTTTLNTYLFNQNTEVTLYEK